MKITKRKLLFPIAILTTAVVSGGIAYALSSANFANSAATWAKANCTSAVASSKYNSVNGQKSIICYNYNKNAEQDETIQKVSSATDSVTSSVPQLVDGNGKVLGTALSNTSFYSKSLKTIVSIDWRTGLIKDDNVINYGLFYELDNCKGKPYSWAGIHTGKNLYGSLLRTDFDYANVNRYEFSSPVYRYFVADSAQTVKFIYKSTFTNTLKCVNQSHENILEFMPLSEVTPDFQMPVTLPLIVR